MYKYTYSNRGGNSPLFTVTIKFPEHPITIKPGDKYQVVEKIKLLDDDPITIYQVGLWMGLDRGNFAEFDTWLFDENNMLIAGRSIHKETFSDYDALKLYQIVPNITTKKLRVSMSCHSTVRASIRAHWGIRLWCHDA